MDRPDPLAGPDLLVHRQPERQRFDPEPGQQRDDRGIGADLVFADKAGAQPGAKACSDLSDAEMAMVEPSSTLPPSLASARCKANDRRWYSNRDLLALREDKPVDKAGTLRTPALLLPGAPGSDLDRGFHCKPAGDCCLPAHAVTRALPIEQLRRELAAHHGADAACPVSTPLPFQSNVGSSGPLVM